MVVRAGIRALTLCLLLSYAYCARTQGGKAKQPHTPTATVSSSAQCEALLLSSLSTFVTSGAGFSATSPPRHLVLQPHSLELNSTNASSNDSNQTFDPSQPHKPLWPDWSERDVLLFGLSAITLFIAAGGGIGGGAVFVPLYIIVGGFTAAQAVALSNITILGGAVANFIANSTKRHAYRDTPLIDWDLIMVMEPTTMLGALLGSYTNKLSPTWFTSCLMAALLVFLTWKLLLRGVTTFIYESNEKILEHMHHQQHQHQPDDIRAPLLAHAHDHDAADALQEEAAAADDARAASKQQAAAAMDSAGAWMDLDAAGDQCAAVHPGQHSSSGGGVRRSSHHSSDDASSPSADAAVVPVPPGLKPLTVSADAGPAAAAPEGAALPRDTPRSARAFSVESTPKLSDARASLDAAASPLVWSNPSSATAAEAEAAGCLFSQGAQQKLKHQQQRRQALLLPRHSTGGDPSSESKQQRRLCSICSICSCLDPNRLQLSTVQAYAKQQLPWQPLLTLFLLSCWVVASDTGKATLACGSLRYWAVVLSVIPPCVCVTLVVRQWLLSRTAVETAAVSAVGAASHAPAAEAAALTAAAAAQHKKSGVIHWTPRNSITYPLVCSLAGIFAGLFGVGGGIVKGPLMLELGVLPDVAAATSATMIMFTAGSAAIVYVNFGGVVRDYAQALLLLGFVVTLAGQLVATHLVKVLKRRSIIIFAMGLLMLLASVAAIYQMGVSTWTAFQHPPVWKWGSICQHR